MIDKNIFRQYDIRGIVNKELTSKNVKQIGYHLGMAIQKKSVKNAYVVVGYDVRKHSKMLFNALISGLNKSGCKVLNIGLVATGVNYFASYQEFKIKKKKIKMKQAIMFLMALATAQAASVFTMNVKDKMTVDFLTGFESGIFLRNNTD